VNEVRGRSPLAVRVRGLVDRARRDYDGHPQASPVLVELAARLDEPLRVAIAGRVKSGKSTLVNALVGEPLAATEVGECTRVVTWYRSGHRYRAFVQRAGSGLEPATLRRLRGAVDIEPGDWTPGELERIVIDWPAAVLGSMTLIDTPGLGSLSAPVGARAEEFLSQVHGSSPADAVVYLARHLHGADVRVLEAFRDDDAGRPSPINAVAVVARADEIGAARPTAMDAAARVAARYRQDPQIRRLCQTAVPVAGMLAFGSSQLTESDFRAVGRLAEAGQPVTDELLLSTDRFAMDDEVAGLEAVERRRLLDLLGLFGVRIACGLLRDGVVRTGPGLAVALRARSGIDELRALLATQFAARSDLLKARVALATLNRLVHEVPLASGASFESELERVEADSHELTELRLLVAVRTGRVGLGDEEIAEVERLVERSGAPITERLGLAADVGDDELRRVVTSSVERWRRRAEHPLAPRDTVDAASVVLRTYEGILLELEPAPVG
jgi:hypothetical protein